MGLRPEYSLGHSEFNDFLFASIGEEGSGPQLTVLSALARLGMDPWQEAARLAALPKEAATAALTATIARLPEGALPEEALKVSNLSSIVVLLVDRLPGASPDGAEERQTNGARWHNRLIWLALAAVLFALLW
ncbi:MAG: hypothetical protein ACM35H_04005 [Bacteroidota bacterium]